MNEPATVQEQLDKPDDSQAPAGMDAKNPVLDKPLEKKAVAKNPLLDKPLEKKAAAITMARLGLAEQVRQIWHAMVPDEVTPAQVKEESYWCHVAVNLKPGDEIIVLPDNMDWRLVLHVIAAERLWAHVTELSYHDFSKIEAPVKLPSIYKIEYAGAHHQWRVLREGKELRDGLQTESIAKKWAANHEMAVTR